MGNHVLHQCRFIIIIKLVIILFTITEGRGFNGVFRITNGIGRWPVVTYRCQTGEKDFGYKELKPGESIDFEFPSSAFKRTLYFCHFYFDGKDKLFDVYSDHADYYSCNLGFPCFSGFHEWIIKEDGFYRHCVFPKPPYFWCHWFPTPPEISTLTTWERILDWS
ncbi:hypothetical protein RND81_10G227100 [Saponaria officinalis]|uniref:S-protein homolog n=1 Tax=Saponaria officinalis TaxID=3572 RepID=A0AAW1I6A8_SAPOF